MKKTISILLVILLSVLTFSACSKYTTTDSNNPNGTTANSQTTSEDTQSAGDTSANTSSTGTTTNHVSFTATNHIEINVKDYGTIDVALDANVAPITVANFMDLAKSGFYDGLTFHRIITGFMIQGGDPLGTGMGGSEKNIKGEFTANGVQNPLSHTRGAISMGLKSGDNDSANSQFFIVQQDSLYLDGNYAVFGYVTSGMDIVDRICEETPVQDGNGTVLAVDQPVITSIKVID
ncbi:MAG: peptidylprolyl isomerase [Eubacteriales bacterium]